MGDQRKDERFSHISKDPRFRPVPKQEKKVKIDKRFASMFKDKNFKLTYSTDKRGLPVKSSNKDNLRKFYNVSSEESEEEDETDKAVALPEEEEEEESGSESEGDTRAIDLARGEGNVETSSSDDSDVDEGEDGNVYHEWGELDGDAPKNDNVSRRLAVCNMDWDRIKAQDLFVLFNSFKPAEGIINFVKVYPSEYGLERLKEENERGPAELVQEKLGSDQEDYAETPEGSKYHMEKLRKYQLNRLRYYYALVECDSKETAEKLYNELEGMEYESSAAQMDLRFVPDDMTFQHEPKSVCDSLPDMSTYKSVMFTTTALQQGKVDLTWDETNPDRTEKLEKAFKGGEEDNDLRAFLASSSSSSSSSEDDKDNIQEESKTTEKKQISKYRALLAEIEDQERKKEEDGFGLEIKWEPGLKTKTEEIVKRREKNKGLTVFEEFLEKKKEKKKNKLNRSRTEERDDDDDQKDDDDERAFSDDELPEGVDLNDPFFQDDSAPRVSKIDKKGKKKKEKAKVTDIESEKSKAELELLMMGEDESKHFKLKDLVEESNLTKSKKKRLKRKNRDQVVKKEDDFQLNVSDPRFSALFSSALYNLDPSDPHYKKTKATEALLLEKQKRRKVKDEDQPSTKPDNSRLNPSLSLLINSVKNKTQNYKRKKT